MAYSRGGSWKNASSTRARHNTAVIATVSADGSPAATPVRYFSLGFEIVYSSWNTSPK